MGLELPESQPVAQSSDVVTFGKPSGKAPPPKKSRLAQKMDSNDDSLDLDVAPLEGPAIKSKNALDQGAAPARQRADEEAPAKKGRSKKRDMIAVAALGAVVLGAGGYFGLKFMQGANEKKEAVGKQGDSAQKHLTSDAPGHWQSAIVSAQQMQKADAKSIEALAILAEAHYASALDIGTSVESHMKQGTDAVRNMRKLKGTSTHIALAEGLHLLANHQNDEAIAKLTAGASQNAKNPNAYLYLGWAYAQKRDFAQAVAAFDKALALNPKRIAAIYGKATSLLESGMKKEATEAFLQITSINKDHFGAQLGMARLAEVADIGGREKRYLEILERPDIGNQDPRTVSHATSLAGDEARKAGRLGVATERYTNALKHYPANLEAVVGQASVSFLKNNVDDAAEKLDRVLALAPTHIEATLLLIEVSMAQGNMDKASNSLGNLLERQPPIKEKTTVAKMELTRARLLASAPDSSVDAVAAYRKAIELSDEGGVEASLELVALLTKLERAEEGVAVLAPLRETSTSDAGLAVRLGIAYMGANNSEEAILLFRDALRQKPTDTEARFQLGRALAAATQTDEAITELQKAYEGSEQREDIGLELAEIYRQLGRDAEAVELFSKVLEGATPSRNSRARAGAYFARIGEYDKAGAIGEGLIAEDPEDPAGLFLSGVKFFQDGEYGDAKEFFEKASKLDPVAQYFDGLGRAEVKLQSMTKGIHAFERSIQLDPNYLEPRLGLADARIVRREYGVALKVLEAAVKIAPQNALVYYLTGVCHLELRDIDTATASFNRAVAFEPDSAIAHYGLGMAHDANAKQKDAAIAYTKATKLGADLDEPWVAEAYRKLGYSIRESGGDRSRAQWEAWENYLERVKVETDASKEIEKMLIPLRNKYK